MIVNVDAKALEWVAGTFLSQDKVALDEIWSGADQHTDNQKVFNLPSRLIAKKFIFRLIYGGTGYSYAHDPDFSEVGFSAKKWDGVIESFYAKYQGWSRWHTELMHTATTTGKIILPTGREYTYRSKNGEWPRTIILNYPVQGFAADLMAIIRVAFYRRFLHHKIQGVVSLTVHDSIVVDVPESEVNRVVSLYREVFDLAPKLVEQWFGFKFNLPLRCEISYGPNMSDLQEI